MLHDALYCYMIAFEGVLAFRGFQMVEKGIMRLGKDVEDLSKPIPL